MLKFKDRKMNIFSSHPNFLEAYDQCKGKSIDSLIFSVYYRRTCAHIRVQQKSPCMLLCCLLLLLIETNVCYLNRVLNGLIGGDRATLMKQITKNPIEHDQKLLHFKCMSHNK